MKLGQLVKMIRKENGLTQRDVAEQAKILRSTVCRVERGEECDPESAIALWFWLITPEKKAA